MESTDRADETAEAADLSTPEPTEPEPAPGSPWSDLAAYIALPRLSALALSADGTRLVATIARLNADKTAYASAIWELDATGERPARRLTRSVEGEAVAAFAPDNSLLFSSKRAAPRDDADAKDTDKVLWCLPAAGGEAFALARRDGGWGGVAVAKRGRTAVFTVPYTMGAADDEADAARRADRKQRKVAALLHEGYPIRFWDHDLGQEWPRLLRAELPADASTPLSRDDFAPLGGDLGRHLAGGVALSPDGARLAAAWQEPAPRGAVVSSVMLMDTASGERRVLAAAKPDGSEEFFGPVFSADGAQIACLHEYGATPERLHRMHLHVIDVASGEGRDVATDWDRWGNPFAFAPDGKTLYVVADEDGASPVFALDLESGQARRLTQEGAHANPLLSPDGKTIYAIRTAYDNPGQVVAVDVASGEVRVIDAGLEYPALPGRLERVEARAADGTRVPGWLCLPEGAGEARPAPLALWIHGGPVSSWNAWSWRWCPWLLVSQGYAVLLPDPALSTGYGWDYIQRGWGRWGEEPYTDLMAITDAIEQRPDIDASRTCAMGGSFGGYMANWVAGHTDRFQAIVSHASLWNLDSFGPTTDASWHWEKEMTPERRAENSPHRHADKITTPMLVVHGDKDYRVPIGEGLALWWALVSGWQGDPEALPHKFLYFPDENHWILTPQHAVVWYETVRAFLAHHVEGKEFTRPDLL